jgi:hypothetical protein
MPIAPRRGATAAARAPRLPRYRDTIVDLAVDMLIRGLGCAVDDDQPFNAT